MAKLKKYEWAEIADSLNCLRAANAAEGAEKLVPFKLTEDSEASVSHMRPCVVEQFRNDLEHGLWPGNFKYVQCLGQEFLTFGDNVKSVDDRIQAFQDLLTSWLERSIFSDILSQRYWRNEKFPVYEDNNSSPIFAIERCAAPVFNFVTYGVHCTAYIPSDPPQIWVCTRSAKKQRNPGMLDQAAAGGLTYGQEPREAMIRELEEEVGLASDFTSRALKPVGIFKGGSFMKDLWQEPVSLFCFEIALPLDGTMMLRPNDGEVAKCELQSLEQVKLSVQEKRWHPDGTASMLTWLVKHSFVSEKNTASFDKVASSLFNLSAEEEHSPRVPA